MRVLREEVSQGDCPAYYTFYSVNLEYSSQGKSYKIGPYFQMTFIETK